MLHERDVTVGWNVVTLKYFGVYSSTREGFHSSVDEADNRQYVYTMFEPFFCNSVFPCFDQPDRKAKMTLSIVCPNEWVVVSNSTENRYEEASGRGKRVLEKFDSLWFLDTFEDPS